MANTYQAGYQAKIRINGQVFSGAEWSVEEEAGDGDCTNTEGIAGNAATTGGVEPGTESRVPCASRARVRIKQASFNTGENWFAAPRNVLVGSYADVQIFPAGLSGVNWDFPSLLILQSNYNGTAKLLQPLEFSGTSDGNYFTPTQANP